MSLWSEHQPFMWARRRRLWGYLSTTTPVPSTREIVRALHYGSHCALQSDLRALASCGYVSWHRYQSRTLRVLVPFGEGTVVSGRVAA